MHRSVFTLLLCLLIASPTASAKGSQMKADDVDLITGFRTLTQARLFMCRLKAKMAFDQAEIDEKNIDSSEYEGCISEGRAHMKATFATAHTKAKKKPAAATALKNYYASWLSAMEGISPGLDERKIDYERRQDGNSTKLDELWSQFEVEMEL